MTADHRAEMASKRGKPLHPNNGHCLSMIMLYLFLISSSISSCPLVECISNYDDLHFASVLSISHGD